MKVYGLWHGGSNYSQGGREDIETFDSLREARDAFERRASGTDSYYPGVSDETPEGGGSEMWLWPEMPDNDGDLYPWRTMTFGPRGGIIVSPA